MKNQKNITIIDYGMGNILSVINALNFLGFKSIVTSDPNIILSSEKLILPGVGSFNKAMTILKKKKLDLAIKKNIKDKNGKILGICLGMHLLAKNGYEGGKIKGIGLIDGEVNKFNSNLTKKYKVPHIGFNKVDFTKSNILYKNLEKNYFYFVHSYVLRCKKNLKNFNFAYCNHGEKFIASFESKNIFGTQFHPEKSQKNGLHLLKNYLEN